MHVFVPSYKSHGRLYNILNCFFQICVQLMQPTTTCTFFHTSSSAALSKMDSNIPRYSLAFAYRLAGTIVSEFGFRSIAQKLYIL